MFKGDILISNGFKKMFKNMKKNASKGYNNRGGFNWWPQWPIFCFISPGKLCIVCALLLTLLLCGVGLYGLIVIVLLVLLFIFVP